MLQRPFLLHRLFGAGHGEWPKRIEETAQLLLEAGGDPNQAQATDLHVNHDARPLVAECQCGHDVVCLLLEHGDDAAARRITLSSRRGHLAAALASRMLLEAAPPTLGGCLNAMPAHSTMLFALTPLFAASMFLFGWDRTFAAGGQGCCAHSLCIKQRNSSQGSRWRRECADREIASGS